MNLVSFVIPCYRSEKTLPAVIEEINNKMNSIASYCYEIILVNDSSPDNTIDTIRNLCRKYDNITGIDLAKNFGQHAALMAGMRQAKGDIVVCLDDDGQTPADEVDKLLNKLNEGYDVVYASYGKKKHSLFRNFGSKVNELMTRVMLGKPKELYISSYFAAKRFVVDDMLYFYTHEGTRLWKAPTKDITLLETTDEKNITFAVAFMTSDGKYSILDINGKTIKTLTPRQWKFYQKSFLTSESISDFTYAEIETL